MLSQTKAGAVLQSQESCYDEEIMKCEVAEVFGERALRGKCSGCRKSLAVVLFQL